MIHAPVLAVIAAALMLVAFGAVIERQLRNRDRKRYPSIYYGEYHRASSRVDTTYIPHGDDMNRPYVRLVFSEMRPDMGGKQKRVETCVADLCPRQARDLMVNISYCLADVVGAGKRDAMLGPSRGQA